jgi:hypothetical protein
MRARHRHLNQRHAGAGIVLDARYINQADNTAVSTWSDRSGNGFDASQSTPANQPTFQTAEIGGNPIVSFDGSNDNLTMSGAVAYLKNVGYGLLVAVVKDRAPTSAPSDHQVFYFSRNGNVTQFRLGFATRGGGQNIFRAGARRLDTDGFTGASTASNANYNILSALGNFTSGTVSILVNNKAEATSNLPSSGNTSNTDSDVVITGATASSFSGNAPIDVALLLAFNLALSDALRMRVHRSAALTYKISCN